MANDKEVRVISVEFETKGYENVVGKLNKLDNEQNKFTRKQKKMLALERGFLKERYRRGLGLKTFNGNYRATAPNMREVWGGYDMKRWRLEQGFEREKRFRQKGFRTFIGNYNATVSPIDDRTDRQKFVDSLSKKFRQERVLRKFGARLVNPDDYNMQFGPTSHPVYGDNWANNTYNKWLASRFAREKAYRESKKKGRAGIFQYKTKDFIDNNIVNKKNDELKKMSEYYRSLEKESKQIAKNEALATQEAAKRRKFAQKQMRDLKRRGSYSMKRYNARKAKEAADARLSRSKIASRGIQSLEKARGRFVGLTNTITQAVGELTMFAGAITMVSYMASSAFARMLKVGEAFANVEKTYLVGAGFRERLYQQGGVRSLSEFDSALVKATKFTGKSTFQTAETLARTGSAIKDAGGKVSMKNLMNVVESAYGLSAITGDDADKMIEKILTESKKGVKGDAGKLGLKTFKLTKSMDTNLELIAKAVKENPIAATAINRGSIEANINRIKSAPNELFSRVYGAHMNQTKRIFSRMDDTIFGVFSDPAVVKHWSKTLTNFEQDMNSVFKKDKIKKAAMDAAEWAAELSAISKNLLNGALWILGNKEKIINGVKEIGKWWIAIQAFKIGTSTIKVLYETGKALKAIGLLLTGTTAVGTVGTAASLGAVAAGLGAITAAAVAFILAYKTYKKYIENEKKAGVLTATSTQSQAKAFVKNISANKDLTSNQLSKLKAYGKNDANFTYPGLAKKFRYASYGLSRADTPEERQKYIDKLNRYLDREESYRSISKELGTGSALVGLSNYLSKGYSGGIVEKLGLGNKFRITPKTQPKDPGIFGGPQQYGFLQQSFLNPNQKVIVVQGDINFSENVSYKDLGLMSTAGGAIN